MEDIEPLDEERVARAKWNFRALSEPDLRAVAARRIELTPEESAALGEVFAERSLSVIPPAILPEYKGLRGFVRRHYRGDYSLARSYWVHTFLFSILASSLTAGVLAAFGSGSKARYISLTVIVAILFMAALWVWGVVGTWASATKHPGRGGSSFWAGAAKVAIVFGVLRNVGEALALVPAIGEHLLVAWGQQPGSAVQFTVRADGRSLLLKGGINDGTAEALEQALQQAPGVRTVVLHSEGGWVGQGQQVAEVIARRKLDTYVEAECLSSCTIAFLAGRDRAAEPGARLGFHAFRAVGAGRGQLQLDEHAVYGAAGLSRAFIERVRATPAQGVWFPEHGQLLQERVLTRLSNGGETASIATDTKSRTQVVDDLVKVPLHRAMRTAHPARFDRIVDAAWAEIQQRHTDREVLGAVRAELNSATRALLAGADDETVEAHIGLITEIAASVSDQAPGLCADIVFRGPGEAPRYRHLLPKSLLVREEEVLLAIVETSRAVRERHVTDQQFGELMEGALRTMRPASARVVATLRSGKHKPAVLCSAGIQLMEAVLALPPGRRQALARALIS